MNITEKSNNDMKTYNRVIVEQSADGLKARLDLLENNLALFDELDMDNTTVGDYDRRVWISTTKSILEDAQDILHDLKNHS